MKPNRYYDTNHHQNMRFTKGGMQCPELLLSKAWIWKMKLILRSRKPFDCSNSRYLSSGESPLHFYCLLNKIHGRKCVFYDICMFSTIKSVNRYCVMNTTRCFSTVKYAYDSLPRIQSLGNRYKHVYGMLILKLYLHKYYDFTILCEYLCTFKMGLNAIENLVKMLQR